MMVSNKTIKTLGFDADDTLWVNEPLYTAAEEKLKHLLSRYADSETFRKRLYETEIGNLHVFGYGAKSFTLSMIEVAIELSSGSISGSEIQQIIDIGRAMINEPVQLLPGVEDTILRLAQSYELMVITKGDLLHQERKIARSGLSDLFRYVEIVSEKTEQTYADILWKYDTRPDEFMMVGNSLRSDVAPVLNIGGHAVHVPNGTTWAHEQMVGSEMPKDYFAIQNISELPDLLERVFTPKQQPG